VVCLLSVVFAFVIFGAQRIYHLSEAHEIFVTGLEFAPNTTSHAIVGPNVDFTLFSISADSQIKAHQLESRRMCLLFCLFFVLILPFIFIWLYYLMREKFRKD